MELWLLQGLINRRANGTLVGNTEVGAIVDGGGFARGRWMAAMTDGTLMKVPWPRSFPISYQLKRSLYTSFLVF
ncbi:hypothetical protein U1Q18_023029 [Sarracenia purpurea var. burkii]